MAGWRREWQDFKKAHPKFEQCKAFKSDVGPQMDDFEDAVLKFRETIMTAFKTLSAAQDNMKDIKISLEGAVTGYKKILSHPDMKEDKSAEKDFDECFDTGNKTLDMLRGVRDELQGFVGATLYQKFNW
jgi:hypothetical protein